MSSIPPVNVLITGAAGQIGYSLIPLFATGLVFGPQQRVNLRLVEINPAMRFLRGAVMELRDGAYPLVNDIQLVNANKVNGKAAPVYIPPPKVKKPAHPRQCQDLADMREQFPQAYESAYGLAMATYNKELAAYEAAMLKYQNSVIAEKAGRETDLDFAQGFVDVDYCVLVGGFPRGPGMVRAELLAKNAPIFQTAGRMLQQFGKVTTKVLVIANPANSNCLMCALSAPKIPKKNFCALTRLDLNRARSQLADKLNVGCSEIKNVIIWGNHSATQVPDVNNAKLVVEGRRPTPIRQALEQGGHARWLEEEFVTKVQKRGKAVIDARGKSSAMSAANGVKDCLRDWVLGTPEGEHVAMAVYTEERNPYGIAPGLFYSFPCVCDGRGGYRVLTENDGIVVTPQVRKAMMASMKELLNEQRAVLKASSTTSKL